MILLSRRTLFTAAATLPMAVYGRNSWGATGSIAPKFDESKPAGSEVPEVEFDTADGTVRTLKDYAGRGVVLNFWATWCAPCVREMPALAKLAGLVEGSNVAVLPLSSDRGGASAVQRYFEEKSIAGLPVLLDPRGAAAHAFGARGIPTTILIDSHGRERGRYEGAADWASDEAVAAVKALSRG
jgi:peroxiredoxin